MTSLVAEALSGAGSLDKASLDDQVKNLTRRVAEARVEICQLIQKQYVDFFPEALGSVRQLTSKMNQLSADMDSEAGRIRAQLQSQGSAASKEEIVKIREQLKETEDCLSSIAGLTEIADMLEEVDLLSPSDHALRLAQLLHGIDQKMEALAKSTSSENPKGLPVVLDSRVIPALKEEVVVHKERLIYDILEWWGTMIHWEVGTAQSNTLRITLGESQIARREASEKLTALSILRYAQDKLEHFATCLMTYVIEPVVKTGSKLSVENGSVIGPTSTLIIVELNEKRPKILDFEKVFGYLSTIFDTLQRSLGCVMIEKEGTAESCLAGMAQWIGVPLLDLLVRDCLRQAVPSDAADMQEFNNVLNLAKDLEGRLREIGLLGRDTKCLEEFAKDTDTLFMDRRCQKILSEARDLVMSDLHNFVMVGDVEDEQEALETLEREFDRNFGENIALSSRMDEHRSVKEMKLESERRLPPVFRFPKCRVSAAVVDLVCLVERTLEEAMGAGSEKSAGRLFEMSRNILELYVELTPIYHEKTLTSVPQIAALFYNNCYYIAHRLMTLGWEVTPRLAPALGLPRNSVKITYVDVIPKLRELAATCMEMQLKSKKKDIAETLKETQGFVNVGERVEVCNKALRGCVMELEQLSRVWKEVLTTTVLLKALGSLTTYLLGSMTEQLLKLEDIPADDTEVLTHMLRRTLKVAEELFSTKDRATEIHKFCELAYFRFKEMIECLNGSMQEIGDRWADGKGPLATYMSAAEVKQLVRALFQNTDRRAALLATIK